MTDVTARRMTLAIEHLVEAYQQAKLDEKPTDPRENWCYFIRTNNERCLNDAVEGGLCRTHWRKVNNEYR